MITKKNRLLKATTLFFLFTFSGCFTIGEDSPYLNDNTPITLDLFAARSYMGGADYEHYYLKNNILHRECGNIARYRGSKKVEPDSESTSVYANDPNLLPKEESVETLNDSELAELKVLLFELKNYQTLYTKLPAPGSAFEMGDPGIFEMEFKLADDTTKIITSIDALPNNNLAVETRLFNIFKKLRGIGTVICNNGTFFGVSR